MLYRPTGRVHSSTAVAAAVANYTPVSLTHPVICLPDNYL